MALSIPHAIIVDLLRARPSTVLALVGAAVDLAPESVAVPVEADLTEAAPPEYRADLVLQVFDAAAQATPRAAFVVEAQTSRDDDKVWSLPAYVAVTRSRLRCPVFAVMVTLDPAIARWARRLACSDAGLRITLFVIGPAEIPVLADVDSAREHPELTLLSALAHGRGASAAVAHAAFTAVRAMPEDRQTLYFDLLQANLSTAARAALEAIMATHDYEYQSEFARRYFGEGREQGREEGREQGRELGLREGILAVLAARGLEVTDEAREAIDRADLHRLERWIGRAAVVERADDLLADRED